MGDFSEFVSTNLTDDKMIKMMRRTHINHEKYTALQIVHQSLNGTLN